MRVYRVAISLLAVVCAGQAWAGPDVVSHGAGAMGGKGVSICVFPDVCKTPATPAVPGVPIPYPNMGESSDRSSGSRKVGGANEDYGYWSPERDLVEDSPRGHGQGSNPWTGDVFVEYKHARAARDAVGEQDVAEYQEWESRQPKKEYEPYEGKPRYVELPEPETDSPPTLTPAEIDRVFENLDREEYYRVLNAHADGEATIEDVEAAYARLPRYYQ